MAERPEQKVDRSRLRLGRKGERLAERYLKRKGFRIAGRNLRNLAGELDLLMWDRDELVIVEVRTVEQRGDVEPSERIPLSKRRQLVRVAEHLIAELPEPLPVVRFDAVIVELQPDRTITHFENAFRPDA